MSVCTFIASNKPLPEYRPPRDYPLEINIDEGRVHDGGTDDNFSLLPFEDVRSYSHKAYAVRLEWNYYTEGRGERLLEYIRSALAAEDTIELWHVWLGGHYEYKESPVVGRRSIALAELSAKDIYELDSGEIWIRPDRRYPERPSFYCLTVRR